MTECFYPPNSYIEIVTPVYWYKNIGPLWRDQVKNMKPLQMELVLL
jgi:hypothetical protein